MNEGRGSRYSLPPEDSRVREPRTKRPRIVITERMRRRQHSARPSGGPRGGRVVAGCGSSAGEGGTPPRLRDGAGGAPAPLAKLYSEANQLLPGRQRRLRKADRRAQATRWSSTSGPPGAGPAATSSRPSRSLRQLGQAGRVPRGQLRRLRIATRRTPRRRPGPLPQLLRPDRTSSDTRRHAGPPDTAFYDRDGKLVYVKMGPYASTTPNSKQTSSNTRWKRVRAHNRAMEAFVVIALIGIGLLAPELLLPTGGILALLGIAGLIVGGILALGSNDNAADWIGGGADHARRPLRDQLLLHQPQGDPLAPATCRNRRAPRKWSAATAEARSAIDPDRQGLHARHALVGAAGRRRRPGRTRG